MIKFISIPLSAQATLDNATELIEVFQEIVDCMVHSSLRVNLTKYLSATARFLKYQYNHHVSRLQVHKCSTDNMKYDMLGQASEFNNCIQSDQKSGLTCSQYRFPYFVWCANIKQHITSNEIDMLTMYSIPQCYHKMEMRQMQ